MIRRIIVAACILAGLLFIVFSVLVFGIMGLPEDPRSELDYLHFILEGYKAIGIGFLIAILGTLIPHLLPETKYKFEKQKEGRQVYSRAKTEIEYLHLNLARLRRGEAIDYLLEVHQRKHLADIYIREMPGIGQWYGNPYETIKCCRRVLEETSEWDDLYPDQRREKLCEALERLETHPSQ